MLAADGRSPEPLGVLRSPVGEEQGDLPPQRRHHLDYAHYRLGESFHNPGFFRRESSLLRLLTPDGQAGTGFEAASVVRAARPSVDAPSVDPDQLRLPGF
jgi:hypothetical protein